MSMKKGTKYFSIKGVSTDEAIAIKEENGEYRKALNEGRYENSKLLQLYQLIEEHGLFNHRALFLNKNAAFPNGAILKENQLKCLVIQI
ncbi:hypothetical protein [Virgibacillus ainsalahensis]